MKKDIRFPKVEHVFLVVTKQEDSDMWEVYMINRNEHVLEMAIVTSRGYDQDKKTSTLRHAFPRVEPGEAVLIEPIDPAVFHLTNEYWVSFYIGKEIYDKKYIFVPDSIKEENLSYIEELNRMGILHP